MHLFGQRIRPPFFYSLVSDMCTDGTEQRNQQRHATSHQLQTEISTVDKKYGGTPMLCGQAP
jgi:hypothetical protein